MRIKRALGINYIETKNGAPVSFSKILDIFKRLSGVKKKSDLSLDRIIKINEMANHHLHRGLRFSPWQMDWAIAELDKLFYFGITNIDWWVSTHAAFETEDIKTLRLEFEDVLIKEYSGAKIKWQMKSEIVDLKMVKEFR